MGRTASDISLQLKNMGVREACIPGVLFGPERRVALVVGACFALLFPLIYVALIALTAWAVVFVALSQAHSAIVSDGLVFAGCLLVLSLAKPLVAAPAAASQPHYLDPEKEPLLFALVRSLASKLGVAAPDRIAVDCNVNCSCLFAGGLSSGFCSRYVLTIGLPLMASLRLDQAVGLLAHELGHALQIKTLRSIRLILTMHSWLTRVALRPDEFDLMLQRRLDTAAYIMRPVLRFARLLAQPGRRILWLLMMMEGAATSAVRRRIEIAADRYQIWASGTDRFVSAVLEINLLAVASQRAIVELGRLNRRGRLVPDYPALIGSIRAHYPEDFVQRIRAGLEQERTGLLSGHPSDRDRIQLARAGCRDGIVTVDLPASALFARFSDLCREVTIEYYQQDLGLDPHGRDLVPVGRDA